MSRELVWSKKSKQLNKPKSKFLSLIAATRAGKPINYGSYMANSTMLAVLGQIVCYTGRQLGWKKAAASDFAFQPVDGDFKPDPPVKPGPDGLYPLAVPGKTKLIKGTKISD